jgi:predicted nucleotide-binding protein
MFRWRGCSQCCSIGRSCSGPRSIQACTVCHDPTLGHNVSMSTQRPSSNQSDPTRRSTLAIPLEVAVTVLDNRVRTGADLVRDLRLAGAESAGKSEAFEPEVARLRRLVSAWNINNQTWLDEYLGGSAAEEYRPVPALTQTRLGRAVRAAASLFPQSSQIQFDIMRSDVEHQIETLESIRERLPMWDRSASKDTGPVKSGESDTRHPADAPVFVVHGSDTLRAESVARFVENTTGRQAIILREMPNRGKTLIEKFEQNAKPASYAIVLLTADDEGSRRGGEHQFRARQNVVFEMGYFFGRLGRERLTALIDPGVEKPSDVDGIAYIPFDEAGAWKAQLFRELSSAGFNIDLSRT